MVCADASLVTGASEVAVANASRPSGPNDVAAPEGEVDVRVLPTKWRGDMRRRDFREAVVMMEAISFDDSPLKGEASVEYVLLEMAAAGMSPVPRNNNWKE